MFLKGELTIQELGSHAYQTFKKFAKVDKVPEKDQFRVDVQMIDAYGSISQANEKASTLKMTMVRF
jgi:S-adenosylmethionine hydrolase